MHGCIPEDHFCELQITQWVFCFVSLCHTRVTQRQPLISLSVRQQFPHLDECLPRPATLLTTLILSHLLTRSDLISIKQYKIYFQSERNIAHRCSPTSQPLAQILAPPMKPPHLNLQFFYRDPQWRINNNLSRLQNTVLEEV
jgi:hypothetical protein